MRLYLVPVLIASSVSIQAMASGPQDSILEFVASLDLNGDAASSVRSFLTEDLQTASMIEDQGRELRDLPVLKAVCQLSGLVFGEDAILDERGTQALVEESW